MRVKGRKSSIRILRNERNEGGIKTFGDLPIQMEFQKNSTNQAGQYPNSLAKTLERNHPALGLCSAAKRRPLL